MKKNILFIIPGLDVGGAEKSLVNLLSEFDYSKYNVDLFLLNKEGMFIEFLPKEVNILEHCENLKIFSKSLCQSIKGFLAKGNIRLAYKRTMFFLINKLFKNKGKAEQYTWKYLRTAIGKLDKKYDVAIGYLEKTSNYICVDCIQANKKIGWVHTEYTKLKLDKHFDEWYMNNLDYVITISEECSKVIKREFKKDNSKVVVIKNVLAPNMVKRMAIEEADVEKDTNVIVSVGRLNYEKGFDIAVDTCKRLVDGGMNLVWYIVGEGSERTMLEKRINEYRLNNNLILIGNSPNPYKYMSKADIYVQPSRFEGKSIAIDEAKILCKPIVVTNFTTVLDQIKDGKNGIISEMNSKSLADKISNCIYNYDLRNKLIKNLEKESSFEDTEVEKLYCLFE